MSVTCGFFNAINHDRRYDAKQMSSIFDGIINDGVFMNIGSGLAVKANPSEENELHNMNIYVEPGKCWFNSTWTLNDAILPITLDDAELVLDRIDAVVLEVNQNDAVRANEFKIIKGTPSTEPERPVLEDSEYVHQHPLAYVYVKAEVTQVTQANITNCIGTEECPYITGILETIDASDLIAQWEAQFNEWMEDCDNNFTDWYAHNTKLFEDWIVGVTQALASSDVLSQVKSVLYTEITKTLPAGQTKLVFENILLESDKDYKVEFYGTAFGMYPVDAPLYEGSTLTVEFEPRQTDVNVTMRIEH